MSLLDFFKSPHVPTHNILGEKSPMPFGKGRIVSFDPRDKKFLMGKAAPIEVTRSAHFWETGNILDQGKTYECTAYAAEQLLMSGPVKNKMYLTPNKLYRLNRLNDEFPGENYDGSSVRASMKVLQATGLIGDYVWADGFDPVRRWVLMRSPVIFGTNWYMDMYTPNRITGFIRPTGRPDGGHAYMIRGADDNIKCPDGTKGAFRVCNSWGVQWGQQGKAWLSYKDADALIKNQGEAVTPVEQYNKSPKIITGVV
jgi:hypothetical protein